MSDSGLSLPTGSVSEAEMRRLFDVRDNAKSSCQAHAQTREAGLLVPSREWLATDDLLWNAYSRALANIRIARRANLRSAE